MASRAVFRSLVDVLSTVRFISAQRAFFGLVGVTPPLVKNCTLRIQVGFASILARTLEGGAAQMFVRRVEGGAGN